MREIARIRFAGGERARRGRMSFVCENVQTACHVSEIAALINNVACILSIRLTSVNLRAILPLTEPQHSVLKREHFCFRQKQER